MEVRRDLESVGSYISRLVAIGNEFARYDSDWGHLKNREDFHHVVRIPKEKRYQVEAVYGTGRDMAIFMSGALRAINNDFSEYPTLTSIVNAFKATWVYGRYDTEVPDRAEKICKECGVDLWSVSQMIALFRRQESLLAAVRVTLQMLEKSDLYRLENDLPMSKSDSSIHVSGVSGSSININSSGAQATVTTTYNEPAIFGEMLSVIRSSSLDRETMQELIDNVQALATSHRSGGFKEAYKDFMQNVSAHITVFTPFLANLALML